MRSKLKKHFRYLARPKNINFDLICSQCSWTPTEFDMEMFALSYYSKLLSLLAAAAVAAAKHA